MLDYQQQNYRERERERDRDEDKDRQTDRDVGGKESSVGVILNSHTVATQPYY